MPGKTETLCRLVLCVAVLAASLHLAHAEPGHLVHKYFRNQIAAEEGTRNARNAFRNGGWSMTQGPSPCSLLAALAAASLLRSAWSRLI